MAAAKKRKKAVKRNRVAATGSAKKPEWKAAPVAVGFRELSGPQFEKLMLALLGADCWVAGLDVGDFHRELAGNKGDGGVDALVRRAPPSPTRWVQRTAVFQAKLSCPSRSKLLVELKKERVAEALNNGHDYMLVTGASMGHERRQSLGKLIRSLYPGWQGAAEVLGEAELLDWLHVYPSVWSLMPEHQRPNRAVKSFEDWEALLCHRDGGVKQLVDFVQTTDRQEAFEKLSQPRLHAVHIEGSPGVGKTRCVLEAFRQRQELVGYCPGFKEELLRLPTEPGRALFGCLVVDECNDDQRQQLEDCFANSPLRLVTIAADLVSARQLPRANAVRLLVLQGDDLEQAAENMGSHLPAEERARIVALSGGYVKLLKVLFAARERYPADPDVQNALLRYLSNDDLNEDSFIALGLPRYFRDDQLEPLAHVAGRPAAELRKARRALENKGLLGEVDEQTSYVTPLWLGEMLARRFWEAGDAFSRLSKAGPGLLKLCLSRLLQMPIGGEVLSRIGPDALVAALGPQELIPFLPAMAAEAPDQVLAAVRRLLPELNDMQGRARLIPAVRVAAWFESSVSPAVDVLADLVGETKQDAEPLRSIFATHLGLTRADGEARVAVIERLVRSPLARLRRLGLLSAAAATEVEVGGFFPQLPEPIENKWRPANRSDEASYRQRAATLLALGLLDADAQTAQLARDEVTHAVRGLVRARHAGASAILLRAWAATDLPIAPLTSVIETIRVHDRDFLGASGPAESTAFHEAAAALAPRGIADRLSMVARPASWGEPDAKAIERVARAAITERDLTVVADWCFSNDAVVAVEIGRALAHSDPERRLLPMLLSRAPAQKLLRTSASYCAALPDIDHLLEGWSIDRSLAAFCFEIFWLLQPTSSRVEELGRLLGRGFLPARTVEQLLLGGWLLRAPPTSALDFVECIAETQPLSAFRLAFQLVGKEPAEGSAAVTSDHLKPRTDLLAKRWFAVPIDQVRGTQVEWEWATTARRIAKERPLDVGLHLVKAVRNESLPYEFPQLLDSLIPRAGTELLLPVLATLETEPDRAGNGTFEGIANFPDHQILEEWATTVNRARVLVRVGLPIDPGGVLERLLRKFDIGSELEARFLSGSFAGDESAWLEAKRAQLTPLLSPPASPVLRAWARRLMKRLDADIARSRSVENAYEIGVLPLPWVAEP